MLSEVKFDLAWEPAVHAEPLTAQPGGRCILIGFSVRETSGTTAATFQLINGQDSRGIEVVGVQLNPSGAARDWYGPQGIRMEVGVFPVVTGSLAGSFYLWRGEP